MDVEMNFNIFAPILTKEEWLAIPDETGKKILQLVQEKIEEFITSKALFETKCSDFEKSENNWKEERDNLISENTTFKARLEAANVSITELENQTSNLTSELIKLQDHVKTIEIDAANIRHQRNLAVDERDEHVKMIQRRTSQIERMQLDINALTKQLEDAVNTKCEALAEAENVASLKMKLEYKENRLEQQKLFMEQSIEELKNEVQKRTDEVVQVRREASVRWCQLETKLAQKTEELKIAEDKAKFVTDRNESLSNRIEELSQKLQDQNETHSKMVESYICELDAKTKLCNAYQTMYEECQAHASELTNGTNELQEMVRKATDKCGELETKLKETTLANEEIIAKKNEYIAMLKKELETANEILDRSKDDHQFDEASASKLLKSGMSYTELYARYVNVNDQLATKVEECTKLNSYITRILKEVAEKAPPIRRIQESLNEAISSNEILKESNDSLLEEVRELRNSIAENERLEGKTRRDNERMKKEIADLSRQVVHLLEVGERLKNGSVSNSIENNSTDSLNSSDIISKWLVTFNDVAELQATNQKLLALVRELSERQEEAESYDPSTIANLKKQLEELRESQNEMLTERDQQNKMMNILRNQRDMYKNLYSQATKGLDDPNGIQSAEKSFTVAENGDANKSHSDSASLSNYGEKIHDLEVQVEKYKKQAQQIKDELDTYKKERLDHEKILFEQIETARNESKEMAKLNGKLTSQAEYNEEHFKILTNNSEILKKQISGLEKQNKIYNDTVIKHEQAVTYLKNDLVQTQTKLSRAEVLLADLQKANDLFKDTEKRLLSENEMYKRNAHQNNLLHSNIELIKATLERNDAESKLRLEAKLDEAHLECSSLRRRLEEEQNNFRGLSEHLEKQAQEARNRMEEERANAEKLRKELSELREELINKTNYIDELSKKLKSSVFAIPDCTADSRKLRELEQQHTDAQAEIVALKTMLKNSKDAAQHYCSIAENEEKKVKDLSEREVALKQELERDKKLIQELQDKCMELKGELSIQMDDQDMASASIKSQSQKLQEELNVKNMDLDTARQQLETTRNDMKSLSEELKAAENKYAREVMLHSKDLESLTNAKNELNMVLSKLEKLESEKQQSIDQSEQCKISLTNENRKLNEEREVLKERVKNMDEENNLLLDQIQQMNAQLTLLQARISNDAQPSQSGLNTSIQSNNSSLNRSLIEDEMHSSEQLFKIVKYLRQEKDIAINKADIIEAEHTRLKAEFDLLSKQLQEAKAQFATERQMNETTSLTAAKHAEILRKLDTLNALTDSNRSLRQERDNLIQELTTVRTRMEQFESEITPLQEMHKNCKSKIESAQVEIGQYRSEVARWRQRANQLLEKSNRTSPEDWKKLQTERETLAKQLTIERGNTAKLNEDNNVLRQNNARLEEQLKNLTSQNRNNTEELSTLREQLANLQAKLGQLSESLQTQQQNNEKVVEENRLLTEDTASKDVTITELKNNLAQVKKIAKKYKAQYEDQLKDIETLKQQNEQTQNEQTSNAEKQHQLLEQQKTECDERINSLEATHKEATELLDQQLLSSQEQVNNLKKEIETLKQVSQEKEDKFKTLFKNAKDRIVNLTEQNNALKEEVMSKREKTETSQSSSSSSSSSSNAGNTTNTELLEKMNVLQQERDDLTDKMQQEKDSHSSEIESLNQRINLLERKLEQQQGAKPSTSSASSEKPSTERPTADIKPMAGHSTNTQTQSISISPWRSGAETPLASIRPMSQQLRTAAVLPTTQTTSSALVPPQQQVHTTGSTSVEALSSSPTSSHTDYVLATSSANLAMLGPRQAAVPPSQSSEDDDSNAQVQASPQQQTLAVISPRVEPPCSGSGATQEQGTSSSSSNTVTTTQAGLKRPRDAMSDSQDQDQSKLQQKNKRSRLQPVATLSDSGADVEYQVPTSSQRDHDDDNVIVVESDEEADPDEGEGEDQEEDTEDYDTEAMDQDNYEDADCQDVEDDDEGGNEVEFIEDSSEVPNQSESRESAEEESNEQQAQSQAISSGSDGQSRGVTISQASTSATSGSSFSRPRQVPSFPHRQPITGYSGLIDEGGMDDGIVPSTPTLFVPRRLDGFGEAVSSPHVPSSVGGRFSFNESVLTNIHNESHSGNRLSEAVPEHTLDMSHLDENSTGRSVPTTPLQSSPQESIPSVTEDPSDSRQSDAEIPHASVSGGDESRGGEGSSEDVIGAIGQPGTSEEVDREQIEGDDGVSSEGEKQPSTEEGEEEGREAEASPSSNTIRTRSVRGNTNLSNRRLSVRMSTAQRSSRQGPTPIVWGEGRPPPFRPMERTRGSPPNYMPRAVARRARGRIHKQFGGRF